MLQVGINGYNLLHLESAIPLIEQAFTLYFKELQNPLSGTENPRVGGSIPSLGTIFFHKSNAYSFNDTSHFSPRVMLPKFSHFSNLSIG